jgi:ribosomal protein S18 acetylase RimI-like enzyme
VIRIATPEDASAIAELTVQLGYEINAEEARRRIVQILGRADHALLVDDDSREITGYIHISVTEGLEHEPRGEIRTLVVHERHRGQQIGERLLDAAEAWAAQRGLHRVRVRSNIKRERAHGFYRRHGYDVTKTQHVLDKNVGRRSDR